MLKEVYDGAYYPRPALTNQGVVFSYQPYEKGSFAEGILHFVIPYS
ncbi:RsiV family protein, partial [uncultured Duncaniella sp.]